MDAESSAEAAHTQLNKEKDMPSQKGEKGWARGPPTPVPFSERIMTILI